MSVLVFNLNSRSGMLHYSSQFCNHLVTYMPVTVVLASYAADALYNRTISLLKIRANPTIFSFCIDSVLFWNHIKVCFHILVSCTYIIHFIDNHPWYIFYSLVAKLGGKKIYTTQHNPVQHSGEQGGLVGWSVRLVNAWLRRVSHKLIVHGENLKRDVIAISPAYASKILVVPHGDYTFFAKNVQLLQPDEDTFLFFGRIHAYKGLDILLTALDKVKKSFPIFTLMIVGSGDLSPYAAALEKHKDVIQVINRFIDEQEVAGFFMRAEFIVLPYKDATGSGIIPIAYAFKRPVIVTDVGELGSATIDNETGYVIKSFDSESLADRIIRMLQDKEHTKYMGEQGLLFSEKYWGWTSIVKKVYDIT